MFSRKAKEAADEDKTGEVVVDSFVFLDGRRDWRRSFRAHCTGAFMEQVSPFFVFDYPAEYRSAATEFLDTSSLRDHHLHDLFAGSDLEGKKGAPLAAYRTGFLFRDARMERDIFHPRDACLPKDPSRLSSDTGTFCPSLGLDLLDLVQGTAGYHHVCLLSSSALLAEARPPTNSKKLNFAKEEVNL